MIGGMMGNTTSAHSENPFFAVAAFSCSTCDGWRSTEPGRGYESDGHAAHADSARNSIKPRTLGKLIAHSPGTDRRRLRWARRRSLAQDVIATLTVARGREVSTGHG